MPTQFCLFAESKIFDLIFVIPLSFAFQNRQVPNHFTPVSGKDRIEELDIFRGFAIFGIFMVNILVMAVSFVYREEWVEEQTGLIQDIPRFILENFFFGKFYLIFSFLFGLGVAMQIAKSKESGQYSNRFFLRRFFSLFLFGIVHILFLWSGDILHIYGALGFSLLLFFRLRPKVIFWSAMLIFLFPLYSEVFQLVVNEWIGFDHMVPLAEYSRIELADLKHNGTYLSGISIRLKEYAYLAEYVYAGMIPAALTMMLLGGYFVKRKLLWSLHDWVFRYRFTVPVLALFSLGYKLILMYYVRPNFEIEFGSPLSIVLMTIFYFADIVISIGYLWLIVFLLRREFWQKMFSPLAYVGRMALTNYILQSVCGYWIMRTLNGYDFLTIAACVVIVIAVYICQIFFSKAWLSRFKFGPLEWFWRCLSYGKILPFR